MALNDIIPEEYENKIMSPESAAKYIESGMTVVTSGFSKVGYPKVVPTSLADLGSKGPDDITLVTSGAVGSEMDDWIKSGSVSRLSPYQSSKDIRNLINNGELTYSDYHIGRVAEGIDTKQWGTPDIALIEIAGITESGGLVPRFSVGNTPAYLKQARKVILELNTGNEEEFHGMRDIIDIPSLDKKDHIPIFSASDRIGTSEIGVDKNKIVAIVLSDKTDTGYTYTQPDEETISIGTNVSDFLKDIKSDGQIPSSPPFQIGVGNLGNLITNRLSETLAPLSLYSEVVHDNVLAGLEEGTIQTASAGTLALSKAAQTEFTNHFDKYRSSLIIRPQSITNHPEVLRRLGVIAINSAVEVDIYGNANSTAVSGSRLLNGIGGSGDFTRNALISIMVLPSTRKGGEI